MAFQQKLPGYEVICDLIQEQGYTAEEVADLFGARPKSVSRMIQRNAVARGDVKPKWMRLPEDDLVKGTLIYGEVVDLMDGYGLDRRDAARALSVDLSIIELVLRSRDDLIQRNVAHLIVHSVMRYERRHGPSVDRYAKEAV